MTNKEKIKEVAELLGGKLLVADDWFDTLDSGHVFAKIALPSIHKWAGIRIHSGSYQLKGKFGVSIMHTQDLSNYYLEKGGLKQDIKVSAEKSPEQIAKDIQRRLLPGYQKWLEEAQVVVETIDAAEKEKQCNLIAIAEIIASAGFRASYQEKCREVSFYDSAKLHAKVSSYSENMMEIGARVNFEKAKRIMAIILESEND